MANAGILSADLHRLARTGTVTLDLGRVAFMDLSAIHAIHNFAMERESRGCVVLHGASEQTARVLDMLGLLERSLHLAPCQREILVIPHHASA